MKASRIPKRDFVGRDGPGGKEAHLLSRRDVGSSGRLRKLSGRIIGVLFCCVITVTQEDMQGFDTRLQLCLGTAFSIVKGLHMRKQEGCGHRPYIYQASAAD